MNKNSPPSRKDDVSNIDNTNKSNLKTLLLKLEDFKIRISEQHCLTQHKINLIIISKLSELTTKITSLSDSEELKYYKLTEEIAVAYFQLKSNEQVLIDHNIIQIVFDYFKNEITSSDHYAYQISQNMVEYERC
ncbi:MAG: hypothetical protein KBD37_09430 [Burkholderiales bacterium]|nr:hypothetical protein [Burkholderiales bacterium]